MSYTVTDFERVVSQFYYTDAASQAQAHQWLVAAQTSPDAWNFVWELLQKERPPEVQFFAATTLHMKIMKSWIEVPSKEYEALRKHILQAILSYSVGPKIVLNRLCIALSAFVLQTMPGFWPNAVSDLLSMFQWSDFQALTPERRVWILLEVLTVIPEEFESMSMIQRHKQTVRHELEKATPQVLSLVQSVLDEAEKNAERGEGLCPDVSHNHEVLCQAVRCASTWLHFGVSLTDCDHLATLLVRVVVNASVNSPCNEAAELGIEALDQMLTHPDTSKMPSIVINLIQRVLCLKDIINHCHGVGNHELMTNLYSLFVSIVEAHLSILLKSHNPIVSDLLLQLLDVILSCTSCPGNYPTQETCSQITFGIWYLLQDELVNMESPDYAKLIPILGPIYQHLITILLRKSQYPNDSSEFSSEDRETFRWYRQDIADTYLYCCNVLHDSTLDILLSRLKVALMSAETCWQPLESCLHAFGAVSENIDEDEKCYLPEFFSILQHLSFNSLHITVATTALDVVGSYATWLNYHPEVLSKVVPLLLMGLNNCDTAPNATMSLKDVTRECQSKIKPYAEIILQTSQRVLSEGKLKQNECIRLMYTVGRVLSVLPLDTILQYLDSLLLPCIDQIKTLLGQEPSVTVKSNLLLRMKMLGMLLSTLDLQQVDDENFSDFDESESNERQQQKQTPVDKCHNPESQPVFIVLRHLMPVLNDVVNKWSNDSSIIQAVFSVFKHGVTTLLEDSIPLIPNIIEIILNSYKKQPTASVLDLSKQISVLVGRSSLHTPDIKNMLLVVTTHTLEMSKPESPAGGDMSQYTDVIDSYLQLMAALIKKNPLLVIEIGQLNISDVFQFAVKALMLPELPTVRSAAAFFTTVISQSREYDALLMCVQIHGEELVEMLLRCIGGEASRANIEPLSDVILALNKKHCDNMSRWLPSLLARQDFPSSRPSEALKVQFGKMILKERVNKRKLQELIREFSLVCRGLACPDFAAQNNASRILTPDI